MERLYRKRLKARFGLLLSALLACGILQSFNLWAQDFKNLPKEEAEKRLFELKKELENAKQREKGLSLSVEQLKNDRTRLNHELILTAKKIKQSEKKLFGIEGRISELKAQEAIIRGSLARRHQSIAHLLATMQRIGRQPPPVIVTQREDALKMVRSAMLLGSIFPELKNQADQLVSRLTALQQIENKILRQRDAQKIENANLVGQRKRIELLMQAKKKQMQQDQLVLAEVRKDARIYAQNIESLNELIQKLRETTRKKTLLGSYEKELAAGRAKEIITGKTLEGEALKKEQKLAFINPGRIKPRLPFPKTKGLLPFPVEGVRLRNFGEKDEFGVSSKGIVVETRDAAQITSPGDGWVIYAGEFRTYGKLLIIDAGGDYHIVLAGMKDIDVTNGQFVMAGEPIARMGTVAKTYNSNGLKILPVLYIEFRKNGRPIDSKPWWENISEKV